MHQPGNRRLLGTRAAGLAITQPKATRCLAAVQLCSAAPRAAAEGGLRSGSPTGALPQRGPISSPRGAALQVMEPTAAALTFLNDTFTAFDQDEDDALAPAEQDHMFATAPELPWHQQPPLHVDVTQARPLSCSPVHACRLALKGCCMKQVWPCMACSAVR